MPTTLTVSSLGDLTEGGSGGGFRVTRDSTAQSIVVLVAAPTGTATAGSDYTGLASYGTYLYFGAGVASVDVNLTPVDDPAVEGTETISISVALYSVMGPSGWVSGTINLFDNDTQTVPTITVTKVVDATEGGARGTFRFTRTGDTSNALTVNYTVGGTATSGTDYTALSGTVTFAVGIATADVTVEALDDPAEELYESVSVTLVASANYGVGSFEPAQLMIVDNDLAPVYNNPEAISFALSDGNSGVISYDLPWGEFDPDATSQTLTISQFSLRIAGREFVYGTSGYEAPPSLLFESGQLTGANFVLDLATEANFPYLSISGNNLNINAVGVAQLFLAAANAPPDQKLPTSKTLQWTDFKSVNALDNDAFTAAKFSYNSQDITGKGVAKPDGANFIGSATFEFRFKSEFDRANSKRLNIQARQTAALLKHERLHLAIGEYMMEKALKNVPTIGVGMVMKATAEDAQAKAESQLIKRADAKFGEIERAMKAITKLYDDETQHSANAKAQADWEMNYMKKMDDFLKTELKWEK